MTDKKLSAETTHVTTFDGNERIRVCDDPAGTPVTGYTEIQDLVIRYLRETAGPTVLAIGAVADGQFLKRVGSTIVSAAAGGGGLQLADNLKYVVNAAVNKLDVFTKSGGAAPDATDFWSIAIPDQTGYTVRERKAAYLSGTNQFIMADAANYWSKGSLDGEIKTAYVYAIWDANGGIVLALGGYSGFTRVPASTTATDDDFLLLEASSTYTKVITDYCVCIGKIRYQYDTADTPDHTIQATAIDAPQVVWNPKPDYTGFASLATSNSSGADISAYSAVSLVVKQSGKYKINGQVTVYDSAANANSVAKILTGSSTYGSAVEKGWATNFSLTIALGSVSVAAITYLNAGDTIHLGAACFAASGTRIIEGDDTSARATCLMFERID